MIECTCKHRCLESGGRQKRHLANWISLPYFGRIYTINKLAERLSALSLDRAKLLLSPCASPTTLEVERRAACRSILILHLLLLRCHQCISHFRATDDSLYDSVLLHILH